MRSVVILGAARTPIGRFLGGLASIPAPRLGSIAIAEALRRAEVQKDQVDEAIVGNVLSAGLGQAPARQAALYAGLPVSVPATTINKMCGSGLWTGASLPRRSCPWRSPTRRARRSSSQKTKSRAASTSTSSPPCDLPLRRAGP